MKGISRYLNKEQIKKLFELEDKKDAALSKLCLKWALRRSEYELAIKKCFEEYTKDKNIEKILFQPKKNNNSRVLNVDINLIKSATKGSWTSEALKKRFQKISKLVGFKVSTHDFRQTFGTNAALEEFTMVQIRDEFGHKSIKSTEKYVAYATQWKDDLRKAAFNPYTFNEGRAYYKECLVLRKKKRELENKLKNLQNNTWLY